MKTFYQIHEIKSGKGKVHFELYKIERRFLRPQRKSYLGFYRNKAEALRDMTALIGTVTVDVDTFDHDGNECVSGGWAG